MATNQQKNLMLTCATALAASVMLVQCSKGTARRYSAASADGPKGKQQRFVVRTADLRIKVNDIAHARSKVEKLARRVGGTVYAADLNAQAGHKRWSATLKVPQARLPDVLDALRKLGRLLNEQLRTKEITHAVLDVRARLSNLRTTEQRYLEIARKSANTTADLLKVEEHLGRVRTRIEQLQATDRHHTRATAMATVTAAFVLRGKKRGAWARITTAFGAGVRHVREFGVVILETFGHAWLVFLLLGVIVVVVIRLGSALKPAAARLTGVRNPGQNPNERGEEIVKPPPTR